MFDISPDTQLVLDTVERALEGAAATMVPSKAGLHGADVLTKLELFGLSDDEESMGIFFRLCRSIAKTSASLALHFALHELAFRHAPTLSSFCLAQKQVSWGLGDEGIALEHGELWRGIIDGENKGGGSQLGLCEKTLRFGVQFTPCQHIKESLHDIENVFELVQTSIFLGLLEASQKVARHYSLERQQFNTPIANFQATQWKLSDAEVALRSAEGLWLQAILERSVVNVSSARVLAGEAALKGCDDAIQILGGIGYTQEMPAERYYRDTQTLLGFGRSNSEHRLLIAKEKVYKGLGQ